MFYCQQSSKGYLEMNRLLIISKNQFGYLTDVYKWAEYLRGSYDVSVVCFDYNYPKQYLDNVNVHYISNKGGFSLRGVRFILLSVFYALFHSGNIIVVYFEHCEILKRILFWKKMQLDIRTLSVSDNGSVRDKYDERLKNACSCFDVISVISQGVANKLNLEVPCHILPLGADEISKSIKELNDLHLIYVGTFHNRRIHDTIEGLYLFLKKHPIDIKYDIIGDGSNEDLTKLQGVIEKYDLGNNVRLCGRVPHSDLARYFDEANIGVSYVPLTSYFEHQPPTKTFEYILSGLFCIGTRTLANTEYITPKNGILIYDTPESFADSLIYIYENKDRISLKEIRISLKDYLWPNIVNVYLLPLLK